MSNYIMDCVDLEENAATKIQALWRGWLLRNRLQDVRKEYQELFREIEGPVSSTDDFMTNCIFGKSLFRIQASTFSKKKPDYAPQKGCTRIAKRNDFQAQQNQTKSEEADVCGTQVLQTTSPSIVEKLCDKKSNNRQEFSGHLGPSIINSNAEQTTGENTEEAKKHIIMELIWVKQAIDSRKQYLRLKKQYA